MGQLQGWESPDLNLKKILVVDDVEVNRLHMQTLFKGSDYTLLVANDGQEALQKVRDELPFLVISDVQMPQMDGLELCRHLKSDEYTRNVAIIFVTAHHHGSQQVSEGLDLGADDFIFRPFERSELLARVRAVARLKRAEEEARRQARTAARRNKELELLNELALAVTSSLNLDEIFGSSMQKLSQLLDAEAVSLLLWNEESQTLAVNVSSRQGGHLSTSVPFEPQEGLSSWVIQENVPLILAEILSDPEKGFNLNDPSIVSLPMVSAVNEGQVIGATAIIDKRGGNFGAADWVLLNSAVSLVTVAVGNARLLQSVQQQVSDLILLNEIGQALTSNLDLEWVLDRTTQLVQKSLRAEAASLWLLNEKEPELVLTASSGPGAQLVTGFRLPTDQGIAGYVARTGEPYFSANVGQDKRYFELVAEISDYPPGSILCVPVRVKDQIIGVVQALHRRPRWFDQNDLRLLYSVASSVGIAIENARLFNQVQEFNRELEWKVQERTRELAEEKEKSETILASMADGLLVLDADDRILTANKVAEGMLGFRLSERVGQPIDLEHLQSPTWYCIHQLANNTAPTASAAVDTPDDCQMGGVLSLQAHAAKIQDEQGQTSGTVIVLRDITALKQVERMKARFMAGVTHELKTPLSVIRLHAKNLLTYQERLSKTKREELLQAIQGQVQLLSQLVEGILELSRLDAGESSAERYPVNLVELIDQVVSELRPLAENKPLTLRWTHPDNRVLVMADSKQMGRVIRNLVDNAVKYTPAGGEVTVHLTTNGGGMAQVQVIDTGIGIPPEHQNRIFDRFYRVDPSHTIPGTGLGLSIVKEIVDLHGGDIQLQSAPEAGSTFIVQLPGVERADPVPAADESSPT